MASPSISTSTSRSHYPSANGIVNRSANATQSLYTSILAPPPVGYARTIHNPSDPPQAAPSRAAATTRARNGSRSSDTRTARSIAEGTRAQAKNRKEDKRKDRRPSKGGHKGQDSSTGVNGLGEDVDMKAAATLTSLLLQSRPSITDSVPSPRSSISAGIETLPGHPYSHFAQSSTRTTTASATAVNSTESSFILPNHRSATPPPHPLGPGPHSGNVTPKATGGHRPHAPTDSEAADLMLYLATSPSPARPTTGRDKDANDLAAFRALGGGAPLLAKGRVLFPGADDGGGLSSTKSDENSFNLGMPGIGSEIPDGPGGGMNADEIVAKDEPIVASPAQQLLPPPPSPSANLISPDTSCQSLSAHPWPLSYSSADQKSALQAPPTPNTLSFINDFINVSPSPIAAPRSGHAGKPGLSSSLRADIGRKLFEEEQLRHQHQAQVGELGMHAMSPGKMQGFGEEFGEEASRRLGAGIDLVST
jgi:hypothetical protein